MLGLKKKEEIDMVSKEYVKLTEACEVIQEAGRSSRKREKLRERLMDPNPNDEGLVALLVFLFSTFENLSKMKDDARSKAQQKLIERAGLADHDVCFQVNMIVKQINAGLGFHPPFGKLQDAIYARAHQGIQAAEPTSKPGDSRPMRDLPFDHL
jgi:hypothetical protein